MKKMLMLLIAAGMVMVVSNAFAAPQMMTDAQMDNVVAGRGNTMNLWYDSDTGSYAFRPSKKGSSPPDEVGNWSLSNSNVCTTRRGGCGGYMDARGYTEYTP